MFQFSKILVAIDAFQEHPGVLELAARLAEKQSAALTVVDVVPELSWAQRLVLSGAEHMQELLLREKGQKLQKIGRLLRRRGLDVKTKVLVGRTAEELIRQAMRGKYDLVLRATRGAQSRRPQFFSSTSYELLRHCPCAVWLCPPDTYQPARRVLAAVDPNPEKTNLRDLDRRIVMTAQGAAHWSHAEIDVLHVWSIYGEKMVKDYMKTHDFEVLESTLREEHQRGYESLIQECGGVPAVERCHLVRGEPTIEIPRFVHENGIDLLVMGTVGRSGLSGMMMGNTAEMILHQVRCAVLALKPQGFVSPVKLRHRKEDAAEEIHVPDVPPMPPVP